MATWVKVEEDWTAETSYEEGLGDEAAAGPSGEVWSGEAGPSSGPLVCAGWLSKDEPGW